MDLFSTFHKQWVVSIPILSNSSRGIAKNEGFAAEARSLNREPTLPWKLDYLHRPTSLTDWSLDSALYYEACCFSDINDRLSKVQKEDDRFIVINAMNEWGEGMALEPSDVYGLWPEGFRDHKRYERRYIKESMH
eukprot:scaffold24635_cov116-Skeletonema_dohrnii-CCMP3373.AAC.1